MIFFVSCAILDFFASIYNRCLYSDALHYNEAPWDVFGPLANKACAIVFTHLGHNWISKRIFI